MTKAIIKISEDLLITYCLLQFNIYLAAAFAVKVVSSYALAAISYNEKLEQIKQLKKAFGDSIKIIDDSDDKSEDK